MNAIINLGNPRKDMTAIAVSVLGRCSSDRLKLTGIDVYHGDLILMTSPAYGAGMTLDCLQEMTLNGLIGLGDRILFVGSMGSLSELIKLGDIVLPNPLGCAYYDFKGDWREQDDKLLKALETSLAARGINATTYKHGSSFAVYDPHTNHSNYTSTLYEDDVLGVDCGEVFIGTEFAARNGMKAGTVLYCSDSPEIQISDIRQEEFDKRASEADLLLNKVAAEVLNLPES